MMLRLIGIGTVFALVAVSYSLLLTKGALDKERLHHAATALERDQWKTAAEAYRKDAEAQAENARLCLDRETQHYKQLIGIKFAELVYYGQWYTPLREALSAFVNETQKTVTGEVKVKLYKGNIINAGVTSPYTLYDEEVASFGDDENAYNQADAQGFINLFGLPIQVKAKLDQKREQK